MIRFEQDILYHPELPSIILSTRYHKHLGRIETVDTDSLHADFNMNAAQEISFDVYKQLGENKCALWDRIVDFKYIYVPEYQEYYEIKVTVDEDDKTIKHVVGTSACEAELSARKITLECNTESDIIREDYVPTVLYNSENHKVSLLHRILSDKCPDYTISHVDSSIAGLQRSFSAEDTDIYSFLTGTVAEELECLFVFDSVSRSISAYDLKYVCNECRYRGEQAEACPVCGNTQYLSYGENTGVYISAENYAESLTLEGDADNVFNCLKIEGGDDLMTATVANINPNGSSYVYHFSQFMQEDMPEELVQKLKDYYSLYEELSGDYASYTEKVYEAVSRELYLTDEMMPEIIIPETTATEQLNNLFQSLSRIAVANITTLSLSSANLAVEGMAKVLVDSRYEVTVSETALSDLQQSGTCKTWTGKFTVTNQSNEEDIAAGTDFCEIAIVGNDYEEYLLQKIRKKLGNEDSAFTTVFEIQDLEAFQTELKKYSLNRLKSFESSYQTCLEVLIENGVTNTNSTFYDADLYNTLYVPYYNRILAIESELKVREQAIKEVQNIRASYESLRKDIRNRLNLQAYIGETLWTVFSHYLREDVYSNGNYISEGLSDAELINSAKELYAAGLREVMKAGTLQLSLSSTLNNLLSTEEFAPFKDKIRLSNWIHTRVDDTVYKQRLISIGLDYGNPGQISVTFSNVTKIQTPVSDVESILSSAKSVSLSYDTVTHQASRGDTAQLTIEEYRNVGLNSALYNIVNTETQDVKLDGHGISCRQYDDVMDDFSDEQLRIINNTIAFTKDNWKTVSAALGKLKYKLNNKEYEDYGLNADHVIAGKVISGEIYSGNYETDTDGKLTQGTYFDLINGDFGLADGKIVYDAENQKLIITGVEMDWNTTNTPEVTVEDVTGLSDTLTSEINSAVRISQEKVETTVSKTYTTKEENSANIRNVVTEYALSESASDAPETGWSSTAPQWTDGWYLWQRTVITYGNGSTGTTEPVNISGAQGQTGEAATTLRIDSSRGTVFKNNRVSTVLSAVIYKGSERITDITALKKEYGSSAYLEWQWQHIGEDAFHTILSTDSRIGGDGFTFTLSPDDVDTKVVFMCRLITE
ncbi:MAG: hypothetical protein ACI39R_09435 [Lachnospiraceae bacterium]